MVNIIFMNNVIGAYREDKVHSWSDARKLATAEFDRPLEGHGICHRVVAMDAQLMVIYEPDHYGKAESVYEHVRTQDEVSS